MDKAWVVLVLITVVPTATVAAIMRLAALVMRTEYVDYSGGGGGDLVNVCINTTTACVCVH